MTAARPETSPVAPPEAPDGFSLAMNFIPVTWLGAGAWLCWCAADAGQDWWWLALGWVYLVPPLVGRAVLMLFGRPVGTFTQDQRGYRVWWVLTQLQTPFNRLPWIEELLRLVPALYPAWIALWGGRVSAQSYVAPGVVIADRWLVRVERKVVLGFRCGLSGHMVVRGSDGRWGLLLAEPVVEEGVLVGGDCGLGPGALVRRGAMLPYGRKLGPHARYPREPA